MLRTISTEADVVVIGGGLGGSTAACILSQAGYEVALLEKERHPWSLQVEHNRLTHLEGLTPS